MIRSGTEDVSGSDFVSYSVKQENKKFGIRMPCFHKIKSFILMRPGIKAPTDTKENAVSFLPGDRS